MLFYPNKLQIPRKPYNVFFNNRGVDTKEKVAASLVYDYLQGCGFYTFLIVESLKPGEKFLDKINKAVHGCKVGIIISSPRYNESLSCLDKLVQLMEMRKVLLPIFCDIEPSELRVAKYGVEQGIAKEVKQFAYALEVAKGILGLRFNSVTR